MANKGSSSGGKGNSSSNTSSNSDKGNGDKNYRDAGTGRYVTEKYADKHPKTTVGETKK